MTDTQQAAVEREKIIRMIEESLWSPVSGPVVWTPEKIEAAKQHAVRLTDAILAALSTPSGEPEALRQALVDLNAAVDAMWNDIARINENKIADEHVTAILKAQAKSAAALHEAPRSLQQKVDVEARFASQPPRRALPEDVRALVAGLRELAMFHVPGSSVRKLLADSAAALERQAETQP